MNTLRRMSFQKILLASLIVFLPADNALTEGMTDGNFSLTPELRMDSGDYGGRDTITTYEFSVTAEYDLSPDLTFSLRVVPYLYQDETYSDVVLVRGRPIHHADPTGTNPHSTSTHHSTDNRILRHQDSTHHEIRQVEHRNEHLVEHKVAPPVIHHPPPPLKLITQNVKIIVTPNQK